ncbi:MAG: response regulator [Cytophagaceae bacterium]|nr:response regulator [Gemmatimonadaceae bacterium]
MTLERRIAVVDDDDAMVETLCDILELHGWETVRAKDGLEAVDVVLKSGVRVVLMDVRMPRMNGVDALVEIKRRSPNINVVLFTASAAQELLQRAERHGVARILKKPVDARELLSVLDGLLASG